MDIFSLIVVLGIAIVAFVVLREFWCWFFKINERVELFKDIIERDKRILHTLIDINDNLKK